MFVPWEQVARLSLRTRPVKGASKGSPEAEHNAVTVNRFLKMSTLWRCFLLLERFLKVSVGTKPKVPVVKTCFVETNQNSSCV